MNVKSLNKDYLFCVLAVQSGFTDPKDVMRAAVAWIGDRTLTTPQRLIGDGVITEQQFHSLNKMAEEMLRSFGGDVEKAVEQLEAAEEEPSEGSVPHEERVSLTRLSGELDKVGRQFDEKAVTAEQAGRYIFDDSGSRDSIMEITGLGRMLIAFDRHLGRQVAVRQMHPGAGVTSDTVKQFFREARMSAQLDHPNIVPVYELGKRKDGSYYYTMKLVRGETLAAKLKKCRVLEERLKYLPHFINLCHAVDYAHGRGVVHRDIRPDNVMMSEYGEIMLKGWGLARVQQWLDWSGGEIGKISKLFLSEEAKQPGIEKAIGSPSYMCPERAAGKVEEIDERSDIWGLGSVLYEMLVGFPPYTGKSAFDIAKQVLEDQVIAPRRVNIDISRDLSSICEKALKRKKSARYKTAAEIVEDIEVYREGGRTKALDFSSKELMRRLASKNKAALAGLSALLLLTVTALVMLAVYFAGERKRRMDVEAAGEREHKIRLDVEQQQLRDRYHLAQAFNENAGRLAEEKRYLSSGLYAAASLLYNPANTMSPYHNEKFARGHPGGQRLKLKAASRVYRSKLGMDVVLKTMFKADGEFTKVAFSMDGRLIASGNYDKKVRIWNMKTGRLVFTLSRHKERIYDVAFSPNGMLIASASFDGTVRLWESKTGELIQTFGGIEGGAVSVAFSPDSALVAGGGVDRIVRIWDVKAETMILSLEGHQDQVLSVEFSPDGETLVSTSSDRTVRLWDAVTGEPLATLDAGGYFVLDAAFSPDGKRLSAVSDDSNIVTWDLESKKVILKMKGHGQYVSSIAYSPDGRLLASAGTDRTVRLWNAKTGRLLHTIEGHNDIVWGVAFSPDGHVLASSSYDGTVKLWEIGTEGGLTSLDGHRNRVVSVAFSPDGSVIASGSFDKTIMVWNATTASPVRTFEGHTDSVWSLDFSPDGKLLASGSWDKTVRLWDVIGGEPLHTLDQHEDRVYGVAFSPDGKLVASTGFDKTVRLWDAAGGELLKVLEGHTAPARSIGFSPDGKLVASGCDDNTLRLWDVQSGKLVKSLEHDGWVTGLDFSDDGKKLASADRDGTVYLWDVAEGWKASTLAGHNNWVNTIRFSPDNKLIASASDDGTVALWSAMSGAQMLLIQADSTAELTGIDFSSDGKVLAVCDANSAILYPVDVTAMNEKPEELIERMKSATGMFLEGFELQLSGGQ